ncbi:hypothetical protein emb_1d0699 [Coriobacteriaceae bacterium EMTCatB1]|nr:hypothetical protein emb_1d0699 [Coriobacteriaceae bacterium EMTCatB1]
MSEAGTRRRATRDGRCPAQRATEVRAASLGARSLRGAEAPQRARAGGTGARRGAGASARGSGATAGGAGRSSRGEAGRGAGSSPGRRSSGTDRRASGGADADPALARGAEGDPAGLDGRHGCRGRHGGSRARVRRVVRCAVRADASDHRRRASGIAAGDDDRVAADDAVGLHDDRRRCAAVEKAQRAMNDGEERKRV